MSTRALWAAVVVWCAALAAGCGGSRGTAATRGALTVGVHGSVQGAVIPGPECEPIPLTDRRQPVVVRIIRTYPHGTDFRYDLEYYGLEPGTFDLVRYLRRKDGTAIAGAPPIEVEITDILPPGQVRPTALDAPPAMWVGGYTLALIVGGLAWVAGMLAFLFLYKPRREQAASGERPLTLADRLRPLTEQARAGTLDAHGKGELERLVLGYWGGRLGLGSIGSVEALQQLKAHEEAGALLRQMEVWLHAPPGRGGDVDLQALLAPYDSIIVEAGGAGAVGAGA